MIPRIYCISLKYTVTPDTIIANPRHRIYSTAITIGSPSNATGSIPRPENRVTAITTTNDSNILINALVTVDIGSTALGK